jgi:putative membrane protein
MEKLHLGARWIFRLRAYYSMIFIVFFLFIFGLSFLNNMITDDFFSGIFVSFLPFLIALIVVICIGEIYARMAYNRWFYEFTPTNLKIEKGIIWKKYSNIPYERVQNIDITRGILARMFGFSTLNIQTAGYSAVGRGGAGIGAEGHIPAVSITAAEKIREFLMKKIGKRAGV